jgi:pimeloyl-ACP methyl ester carboxylesterase
MFIPDGFMWYISDMATFVLVHGYWLGGWAWGKVAQILRSSGHTVYPVTLTGLGERAHLAGPYVDLDTHILDVTNLLHYEDLHDVVVVGHSYGANVIAGAANDVPDRISKLIYVDTWPLPQGVAMIDMLSPDAREAQQEKVTAHGSGWGLPMPSWEELDEGNELRDLGNRERRIMRERAVDQPYASTTQPVHLKYPDRRPLPRTGIWCTLTIDDVNDLAARYPAICSTLAEPDWEFVELPTGHWPMFSRPHELAALLVENAGKR